MMDPDRYRPMERAGSYSIEEHEIAECLRLGTLPIDEALSRAPLIAEDLRWVDFEQLSFSPGVYPAFDHRSNGYIQICIPEYRFGETNFSVSNAINSSAQKPHWFGGTGLDRGHLQLLSQVSLIGRRLIPHYWLRSRKLKNALRNPPQHLSTIEEIWWLDRWLEIESVTMGSSVNPKANTDVDWSFKIDAGRIQIHFEVKRILSDCIRHARGIEFGRGWFQQFIEKEVLPKFRRSFDNEVNILGISLFGEIDRQVQSVVGDWLTSGQTLLDGIIITSRESRFKSSFDRHFLNAKARALRPFLKTPGSEDLSMAFALDIPISIPGLPV